MIFDGRYDTAIEPSKSLAINDKNREKIEHYLTEAQKGCKVRLIEWRDILEVVDHYERKFSFLTKKCREGMQLVYIEGASRFPNRYKGVPQGTFVCLVYTKGSYRLTRVGRTNCNVGYPYEVILPEEAKKEIIHHYERYC